MDYNEVYNNLTKAHGFIHDVLYDMDSKLSLDEKDDLQKVIDSLENEIMHYENKVI